MTFMSTLTRFGAGGGGAAIPDVTVATFADLPTTRPDGYLVAVTSESGLSDVIVRWDDGSGVWQMERVVTTAHPPLSGQWYSSGGITVNSAGGCSAEWYDLALVFDPGMTMDASAGGGTRPYWLPVPVYGGTPTGFGFALGTEANAAARLAQGLTDITASSGTITEVSGYMQTFATGGGSVAITQCLTSGVSAATKYYMAFEARLESTVVSGVQRIGSLTADGTNAWQLCSKYGAAWAFSEVSGGNSGTPINATSRRDASPSAPPNLSSDPEWIHIIDGGRNVLAWVYRGGILWHTIRRGAGSVGVTRADIGTSQASGVVGDSTGQFRNLIVATW